MSKGGAGSGSAEDVDITTVSNDDIPMLTPEEARAIALEEAAARVAGCQARVDKAREHLAGAETALALAIAEQEAI